MTKFYRDDRKTVQNVVILLIAMAGARRSGDLANILIDKVVARTTSSPSQNTRYCQKRAASTKVLTTIVKETGALTSSIRGNLCSTHFSDVLFHPSTWQKYSKQCSPLTTSSSTRPSYLEIRAIGTCSSKSAGMPQLSFCTGLEHAETTVQFFEQESSCRRNYSTEDSIQSTSS